MFAKFQLPSLSKSGLKVPGGVVGWLRPILVFSFNLIQAEQFQEFRLFMKVTKSDKAFKAHKQKFGLIYWKLSKILELCGI